MEEVKTYYRRNLPHYQPPNATYFISFRLAGSLPVEIIRLKEEREAEEKRLTVIVHKNEQAKKISEEQNRHFSKFDALLDKGSTGPMWLKDDRVASIVAEAMHYRDGAEYELIAYCIMPNHVHLVIYMFENVEQTSVCSNGHDRTEVRSTAHFQNYKLVRVLRNFKGSTSREANKILQRSGAFWQHESYDHVVRDGKELDRIISYVLNNPVKAGFVDEWRKWKWSYCKYDVEE
jgi:putative transposase